MRIQISHTRQWLRQRGVWIGVIAAVLASLAPLGAVGVALAADSLNDFNIQVSPSPIVVSVTPGKAQTATMTVRNFSNHSETLYPKLNGFTVDKKTRAIKLIETPPANIQSWVTFADPSVTIAAGNSKQLAVRFNTPQDVGFSYAAALTLARSPSAPTTGDGVHLRGTVAVFCLINVNRPDAKRELKATSLTSDKNHYQFLPANFTLTVENTGNTIAQPSGSLFIQRSFNDGTPIATLPINPGSNYILPGSSREFTTTWNAGFPVYKTGQDGRQHLSWDWRHLNDMRFGRYVAKAVLVYNDGQRDVPVIVSKTFWVIPWTLIICSLVILIILVTGIVGWGRIIFTGTKKVRRYAIRRK